jgi:hypothetical protein
MKLMENVYFQMIAKLFLIVYASILAPRLSADAVGFMQSAPVRIAFIIAIVYVARLGDLQMSLLLVCALVLTVNSKKLEGYINYGDAFKGKKNLQTLLDPKYHLYPGCVDMKLKDLLDFFEGDKHKMQEAIHYVFKRLDQEPKGTAEKTLMAYARAAGLPYNAPLNDDNAPLLATLLINYGYKLSDSCLPPQ